MKTPSITLERLRSLIAYDPALGTFTWKVQQGKSRVGSAVGHVQHGYAKACIDKEQLRLSRVAWFMTHGVWPSGQIDHIDGNKLNNRISNLRDVPMSVNMQNRYSVRRKNDGLPYGVSPSRDGKKFVANIRVGTFETAEEASEAFMNAKRLLHSGCTR